LLLLTEAQSVVKFLQSKGVPTTNLREITEIYGEVSVDDPRYYDDRLPHQYIANVWNSDMELGIVQQLLDQGGNRGGFNNMKDVAMIAFVNPNPMLAMARAYEAILKLNGVIQAVDALLFQRAPAVEARALTNETPISKRSRK
jgi:hypothetical protein